MKFLLNKSAITEHKEPAYQSLLEYLRQNQQLTGTKEGCASGDCGACTVLVGSAHEDTMSYKSVNACITPLYTIQNKHVVTVEHLVDKNVLHPAQREMVRNNGSQCGFCTPGFVMSLAGLYEKKRAAANSKIERSDVCDAISGNLCRCTGYKPIIESGLALRPEVESDKALFSTEQLSMISTWSDQESVTENYHQPKTIIELDRLIKSNPNAKMVAGGTDLMLSVTQDYQNLEGLIDLSSVTELTSINQENSSILIGAAVTYSELEDFIEAYSTQFLHLLHRLGSRQIRNQGTLGGNIANASPIADMPPILLAMDAKLHIHKNDGTERVVPIDQFYLSYKETVLQKGEYLRTIEIAESGLSNFHRFSKVSKRVEDDISSVMTAIRFDVDDDCFSDVRFAFGGVAATPIRVVKAEQALIDKAVNDEDAIQLALAIIQDALKPINDVRASAAYRSEIANNLVYKAWLEINNHSVPNLFTPQEMLHA